jgi:prepilin-type N-terminal cleavage/methylation domain-containing protein
MRSFRQRTRGFTLVEILIVVMIIAILAVIALMLSNPTRQRQKLYDVKRKRDLNQLKGLYALFYDQHSRYPTGEELCYDTPTVSGATCTCHICGVERDNKVFGQQLQTLYCDPEHPKSTYVYQYACGDYPDWYKIYTHLSIDDSAQLPAQDVTCRYGVSSKPNAFLEPYSDQCGGQNQGSSGGNGGGGGGGGTPVPTAAPSPTPVSCPSDPVPKYCKLGGVCNICGLLANCQQPSSCDQPTQLYSNSLCTNSCN